jgi:hypothetical protein
MGLICWARSYRRLDVVCHTPRRSGKVGKMMDGKFGTGCWICMIILGYILGYYFPQLAKATVGKIKAGPNG